MMRMKKGRLLVVAAAVLVIAAGCSSSKSSAGSTVGQASTKGHTFTLGVLVDQSGPAASSNKATVQGVQAGIARAEKEGYHLNMVVADAATSPAQALAGAQRLVQHDHVFAVIEVSAVGFAATSFLTSHGIPVLGAAADPSWITNQNMFSVWGH
jgi:branched-chain amino acid transport system substrate-binding protein